jgi:hypothetical protein
MSYELKIYPRPGLEVCENDGGTITIRQVRLQDGDDLEIEIHPDDVDRLCKILHRVRGAIARNQKE